MKLPLAMPPRLPAPARAAVAASLLLGCGWLFGEEAKPASPAPPKEPPPAIPEFLNRPLKPGQWVEFDAAGLPGMAEGARIRIADLGESENGGRKVAALELRVVMKEGGQQLTYECDADPAKLVLLENPFSEAKAIYLIVKDAQGEVRLAETVMDDQYIEKERQGKGRSAQVLRFATQKNGLVPFLKDIDWKEAGKEKVRGIEVTVREGTQRKDASPDWKVEKLKLLESGKIPLGIGGLEAKGECRKEGEEKPVPFETKLVLEGSGEGAKGTIDRSKAQPPLDPESGN